MKTAVQWLVDELEMCHVFHDIKNTDAYQTAKQIEKQQMFEYIEKHYVIGDNSLKFHQEQFEQYYTENYKSE